MGDRDRNTRREEQQRVDRRDAPSGHRRERILESRPGRRPLRGEIRPEQLVVDAPQIGNREQPRVVERPEKGGKEHDLRENEPAHAPAERNVLPAPVLATLGLAHDVAEPARHHEGEDGEPAKYDVAPGFPAVQPARRAGCHAKQGGRSEDHPVGRLRNVVVLSAIAHLWLSSAYAALPTMNLTSRTRLSTKIAAPMSPATITCAGFSCVTSDSCAARALMPRNDQSTALATCSGDADFGVCSLPMAVILRSRARRSPRKRCRTA